MRVTGPLLKVLSTLLDEPEVELYGLEIIRRTGLKSGTLYPVLDRLVEVGWAEGRWEADEDARSRGPRRRFYRLTAEGVHEARLTLLEHGVGALRWT